MSLIKASRTGMKAQHAAFFTVVPSAQVVRGTTAAEMLISDVSRVEKSGYLPRAVLTMVKRTSAAEIMLARVQDGRVRVSSS